MKKVITEHSNLLGDDYLSIGKLFLTFWGKFLPHLQNQCTAKDEAASSWVVTKNWIFCIM